MSRLRRIDPFDDPFHGFFVRPVSMDSPTSAPSFKMDVTEQANAFVVHAELPGARKEDIHVQIEGNLVSITAEVKQHSEVKEGDRVLRAERYFGHVSRSFQLSQEIDDAQAAAKFANGVLELTLPKKTAGTGKRLVIE